MKYVLGFGLHSTDLVLLQLKSHPDFQKGRYNGIGGKVEDGESEDQAMAREAKEEIDFNGAWNRYCSMFVQGHVIYVYKTILNEVEVTNAITYSKLKTDEPCMLFHIDDLPKNILRNLKHLIPLAMDNNLCYSTMSFTERS